MKKTLIVPIAMAALLTSLPALSQTIFFNDTFGNGSTLNNASPAVPTANSANYALISTKSWSPAPALAANNFSFGIASSSSGVIEAQSVFTTNTITLTQPGDYVQLAVVFTNTTVLTTNCLMGVGLYSSGLTNPIAGGMNGTATSSTVSQPGGANQWVGYVAQLSFTGGSHRIMTRAAQTAITGNDQDLIGSGSGTSTYNNPAAGTIGSSVASTLVLTNGYTYTEVLSITLLAAGSEAITNTLYSGPTTNSPILAQFGAISTNSTYLTSIFDGLALGWRSTANNTTFSPSGTFLDISSIQVSGQESVISGPPLITSQPVPAVAATNGYAEFVVAASGFNVTYQWYRNGTILANGGDIAGVTQPKLVISPCQSGDSFPTLNGYYCKVSGAGGFSTNSFTNSLTLYPVTNLTWTASAGATWDANTTPSFEDQNNNQMVFIGGDTVNFVDAASANNTITLSGDLAPASMSVNTATAFTFGGSGSIVGPGSVTLTGAGSPSSGTVTLNANNTYSGGTTISNGVYLSLKNYGGFGTGPVNLNDENGTMEFFVTGSAATGINGPVNVNDDYTIQLDGSGTFSGVFLGDLNGVSGMTLTFNEGSGVQTNRIRLYGTNSLCNSAIVLNGPSVPNQALYYGMQFAPYNGSGTQTFNGVISGNGGVVERGSGNAVLGGQNTYSGGTFVTAGNLGVSADSTGLTSGPFGTGGLIVAPEVGSGNGTGNIFASGGAHTIANPVVFPSNTNNQTLGVGGTNALTLTGNIALNGADGSIGSITRTFSVGNTALTTFSGVISDGGQNCNLTKAGTGVLALSAAETYTGTNTISGGTLLVNGSVGNGPTFVNANGTLGGSGTIGGPVLVTNGAALAPGNQAIGTLTINNTLSMAGGATNYFMVSKTGNLKSVITANTVNYNGTLSATNIAGASVVGDSYTIFNAGSHSGNFTNIIGSPGAGLVWAFNPTSGVLSVASGVIIPNVPPKISSFVLSGNNMTITATNGVNGGTYYLLGTTNLAQPLSQWVSLSTNVVTASGGSETFTFVGTNVFSSTLPQRFYTLSSTNN